MENFTTKEKIWQSKRAKIVRLVADPALRHPARAERANSDTLFGPVREDVCLDIHRPVYYSFTQTRKIGHLARANLRDGRPNAREPS